MFYMIIKRVVLYNSTTLFHTWLWFTNGKLCNKSVIISHTTTTITLEAAITATPSLLEFAWDYITHTSSWLNSIICFWSSTFYRIVEKILSPGRIGYRAESCIRPFATRWKCWLFADTPKGARASGIRDHLFLGRISEDKTFGCISVSIVSVRNVAGNKLPVLKGAPHFGSMPAVFQGTPRIL